MNEEEILYQIVGVNSEFKKGFPDKITTILKNGITGKTYTDYDFKNHRYLYTFINDNFNIYDRLEEKDKKIERLNNIINELEKYINKLMGQTRTAIAFNKGINDIYETKKYERDNDLFEMILDKLKELKENNNA